MHCPYDLVTDDVDGCTDADHRYVAVGGRRSDLSADLLPHAASNTKYQCGFRAASYVTEDCTAANVVRYLSTLPIRELRLRPGLRRQLQLLTQLRRQRLQQRRPLRLRRSRHEKKVAQRMYCVIHLVCVGVRVYKIYLSADLLPQHQAHVGAVA